MGATNRPFHRLQGCLLEAARHGTIVNGFHVTKPSNFERTAVAIAEDTQRLAAHWAVKGHRSWFRPRYVPLKHALPYRQDGVSEEFASFIAGIEHKWDLYNHPEHVKQVAH